MLDWPLLEGPIRTLLQVGAASLVAWLLIRLFGAPRPLSWKAALVAAGSVLAVAVTWLGQFVARHVLVLFPDRLTASVYVWVGIGLFVVCLGIGLAVIEQRRRLKVTALAACAVAVLACANQVNATFGAYPTVRYALGIAHPDDIALPASRTRTLVSTADRSLESQWERPADLDSRGKITTAVIPGSLSSFAARPAKIYLPPAYFAPLPPRLPVLILLTGQPGTPQDWLGAGRLSAVMDSFAAEHHGLAPVVVVPDPTGGPLADPLCLDSRRGKADSYLAVDVPRWISAKITVAQHHSAWSVAGASYGGTCALQLATNHPDVYPTFLDIAGSVEPTLGDRNRTVAEAFGGDFTAFERINPLTLLGSRRYPDSAGAVVAGTSDAEARVDGRRIVQAGKTAGMQIHLIELPGAHDWRLFSSALRHELPFLARKIGLID
ncbi:esterase [Mycolicibacterium fluoranthenivorans]|uniref:Esterase n=1 Tax=Mycolicibacterium fluoranthenivorans TaxID=258505 RepID=A0A7G8P6Z1_9MYCO|nr:alpha/beta hydrolase-fold protein [Mycolicibacterium fluoranthenivorans]QNJ90107.1 esterase [Mycolicibacterium fluoranthenivorans]